ncbi:helix-turn-helix transcriptional regulator [Megasphaera elsdenii]|uniref:helix-turn-helix domain-containing protein n=1 Tax=Megasphaera elsdenii TaxID=907 RepID=UPI002A7F23B5|nr:helix-turn-helix transcriptional regulator [Megasphaera elsdenii]MCI7200478.1 helix-turn-helix domain-containing protein [Megasphaera elsdenii]MDY4265593.1 helix-turn-helix transcriptional regulator [Megasphaera elsdenii]
MVNIDKLKGKIREKRYTIKSLAITIGIDPATLYRRFENNGISFTIYEVTKMAEVLELTYDEINAIFFAQNVA